MWLKCSPYAGIFPSGLGSTLTICNNIAVTFSTQFKTRSGTDAKFADAENPAELCAGECYKRFEMNVLKNCEVP